LKYNIGDIEVMTFYAGKSVNNINEVKSVERNIKDIWKSMF